MVIETERLLLKLAQPEFAETCAAYYQRNKEFLSEFEQMRDDEFYTTEYQKNLLIDEKKRVEEKTAYPFYIFRKEEPDVMIGKINLNSVIWGAFCSCYVGVKMDKDFINKGYMTEAMKTVISYAFDVLGLHRIEGNIMPRNKRSLRVAEKCGFQYEGLSEKYLKIHGVWEDHVHMVIRNHKMEM
ncbi:MAG: GNAT family N-acetyltransferase [Brotaphodocola sp.]